MLSLIHIAVITEFDKVASYIPCNITVVMTCNVYSIHHACAIIHMGKNVMLASSLQKNGTISEYSFSIYNCMIVFRESNCKDFGLIDLFIAGVNPTALVYKMIRLDYAILQKAGHPCRHSLIEY